MTLDTIRQQMREALIADEAAIDRLIAAAALDDSSRQAITADAVKLVEKVRAGLSTGMLESFLSEYSLSTSEGIALMCLAEALLRVPDTGTIDDLIEDKIASARWLEHFDASNPLLVHV